VGLIALAGADEERARKLRGFVGRQVAELNSTLIDMVDRAMTSYGHLDLHTLAALPEWSAFVQYLAHTYRQIGDHEEFAEEIEQVLRGTLGFQSPRRVNGGWAAEVTRSVREYAERLSGKALGLVDGTGFSWERVAGMLKRLSDARIDREIWYTPLFEGDRRPLALHTPLAVRRKAPLLVSLPRTDSRKDTRSTATTAPSQVCGASPASLCPSRRARCPACLE
jgi:hypothetical protein